MILVCMLMIEKDSFVKVRRELHQFQKSIDHRNIGTQLNKLSVDSHYTITLLKTRVVSQI